MSSNPGSPVLSRRRFLGWSQAVLAAVGATGFFASRPQGFAEVENAASADDYYALDWFLEQNEEADQAEYVWRVDTIVRAVKNIPTMKVDIFTPEFANHAPHAMLTYDPKVIGISPKQVQERLRATQPRIELNGASGSTIPFGPHSNENTLVVATWMMQPGDAEIVGRHLHEVLSHPTLTLGN
jgi:hypothetical protein